MIEVAVSDDAVTRRTAVRGLALVGLGVPVLTACGAKDAPAIDPSAESDGPGATAGAIAATADIPLGAGKVFGKEKIVVVQPAAGEFKAYSAVCPHQSCLFTEVIDNSIRCGGCHQSEFSSVDGSNTVGPNGGEANLRSLGEVAITVTRDSISLA